MIAFFATALVGLGTAFAVGPLLRRLPEPDPSAPGAETKIRYADLAGPRFALGCGLVSVAFGLSAWLLLPARVQAPWIVLASAGVVLAIIDLRTTWLPLRLCHLGWLLMALAIGLSAVLTADPRLALRGLVGGLVAAGLYAIVWAISRGGFGFGDVRFAPLVGAASAGVSWVDWVWTLLLGTVIGGLVGVVLAIRGRRGAFPYAPAMLLGCYVALFWTAAPWTVPP